MGEEKDHYGLFVHSDSFSVQSNRRELNECITNEKLLPLIADFICEKLIEYKNSSPDKFKQLYISLLLSNPENDWVRKYFWERIKRCVKENVPVDNGDYCANSGVVKIKNLKTDIDFDAIGMEHIRWFAWNDKENKRICKEARDKYKLGLSVWNINSIVENADIKMLAIWMKNIPACVYNDFMKELADAKLSKITLDRLQYLPLQEIGGERISWESISANADYVVMSNKTEPIANILNKLGYKCTSTVIDHHILSASIKGMVKTEKWLFGNICDNRDLSVLNAQEKYQLISAFRDFYNVGPALIRNAKLFRNQQNELKPLCEMVVYDASYPEWLSPFVINKEEYNSILDEYLGNSESAFPDLMNSHYKNIIDSGLSPVELYDFWSARWTWPLRMTEKIINTYGITEKVVELVEKQDIRSRKCLLQNVEKFRIDIKKVYTRGDLEYRIIAIALDVYDDKEIRSFVNKLYVGERSVAEYTISDTITLEYDKDKYLIIPLAKLLPEYEEYGKTICKIRNSLINFSETQLEKLLSIKPMNLYMAERESEDNTPYSYLLAIYLCRKCDYRIRIPSVSFTNVEDTWIYSLLDLMYEQKLELDNDCFRYDLSDCFKKYFRNEYLNDDEVILSSIESWADSDEKRSYLKSIGVQFEDAALIKFRKKLIGNEKIDENEVEAQRNKIESTIEYLTDKGKLPFVGDNQIAVCRKIYTLQGKSRYPYNKFSKVIDLKKLRDKSVEYNIHEYLRWKNENTIALYIYDGLMPQQLLCDDKILLCTFTEGDYYDDKGNKSLYISKEKEPRDVLYKIKSNNIIPFSDDDWQQLFLYNLVSKSEVEMRNRKIDELENELQRYKARFGTLEESSDMKNIDSAHVEQNTCSKKCNDETASKTNREKVEETIKAYIGGGYQLPREEIEAQNVITRWRVLNLLENGSAEYNMSPEFDEEHRKKYIQGDIKVVPLTNGKSLLAQGAKGGIWYVSPNTWRGLDEEMLVVSLCTGNEDDDFIFAESLSDIEKYGETKNVLIKVSPHDEHSVMESIKTVFPGEDNHRMDIHLMVKVHSTGDSRLNDIFDKVFNVVQDDFRF